MNKQSITKDYPVRVTVNRWQSLWRTIFNGCSTVIPVKKKLKKIIDWYSKSKLCPNQSIKCLWPLSCAWWCLAHTGFNPHASSTLDILWAKGNPISSCQWICISQQIYWSMLGIVKIIIWTVTDGVLGVTSQLSWQCLSQTQHLNGLSLQ